jgi:hypothetical protein
MKISYVCCMDEPVTFDSVSKRQEQVTAASVLTALQLGSVGSAEMALARWAKSLFRSTAEPKMSRHIPAGVDFFSLEIFEHKIALHVADDLFVVRLEQALCGFCEHIARRTSSSEIAEVRSALITKIQENTPGRFVLSFRVELHFS